MTKEATKAPAKKAEAKEKIVRDTKNGITRPGEGTITGRVWGIADAISATANEDGSKSPAMRAPVLNAAVAEKINESTAATQYGKWRKFHGLVGSGRPAKAKEDKAAPAAAAA